MKSGLFPTLPKQEVKKSTGELALGNVTKKMPLFKVPGRDQLFMYFQLHEHNDLVKEGAKLMAEKIRQLQLQRPCFVTSGISTIALAHELTANYAIDGVMLCQDRQISDVDPVSVEFTDGSSFSKQRSLWLDKVKAEELDGRDIFIIDDRCSSGETLRAIHALLVKAGVNPACIHSAMVLFTEEHHREELKLFDGSKLKLFSFSHLDFVDTGLSMLPWMQRLQTDYEVRATDEAEAHEIYLMLSEERARTFNIIQREMATGNLQTSAYRTMMARALLTDKDPDFTEMKMRTWLTKIYGYSGNVLSKSELSVCVDEYKYRQELNVQTEQWNKDYIRYIVSQTPTSCDMLGKMMSAAGRDILFRETSILYEYMSNLFRSNALASLTLFFKKIAVQYQPENMSGFISVVLQKLTVEGNKLLLEAFFDAGIEVNTEIYQSVSFHGITSVLALTLWGINKHATEISGIIKNLNPADEYENELINDMSAWLDGRLQATHDIITMLIQRGAKPGAAITDGNTGGHVDCLTQAQQDKLRSLFVMVRNVPNQELTGARYKP